MALYLTNTSFMLIGIILGMVIGYSIAIFRIRAYLKKYYPETDFGVSTKERKEILSKEEEEKDVETKKEKDK